VDAEMDLSSLRYYGADISSFTVAENNRCHASSRRSFHFFDLTCMVPLAMDLLLVRDVLFHMNTSLGMRILQNIDQSGAKYLVSTAFVGEQGQWTHNAYVDTAAGRREQHIGYYNLNLMKPPFCLDPPISFVEEVKWKRNVGIWKLPLRAGDCSRQR
jgi:hypothetical protein